jgi:hypothetical protein
MTTPKDDELDEILQELSNTVYRHGQATRTNTPFHYGEPMKEAKQAIQAEIERQCVAARVDELENVIKHTVRCYDHDDRGRVIETPQTWLMSRRNELEAELKDKEEE